jgi:hypothetical protein
MKPWGLHLLSIDFHSQAGRPIELVFLCRHCVWLHASQTLSQPIEKLPPPVPPDLGKHLPWLLLGSTPQLQPWPPYLWFELALHWFSLVHMKQSSLQDWP